MSALRPIVSESAFPGNIAVSGAAGRLGGLLVRNLHRSDNVFTIDSRDFSICPADVKHFQTSLRGKDCRNIFRTRRIKAVVHLGSYPAESRTGEKSETFANSVEDFARLLFYCDKYKVEKLVLLSSADVYGARARNPQFLTEESPLLAADLSALRDVDMMAISFFWKRPDIETVILRPSHITGRISSAMTRYLRLSPVPKLMGYDPMIQLVHEDDVISAVRLALKPGSRGIFNIAGPRPLPLSHILRRLGRETIPIPHPLARIYLSGLERIGRADLSPAYVDYIRFVCMVDDSRAKQELAYSPERNLEQTLEAIELFE